MDDKESQDNTTGEKAPFTHGDCSAFVWNGLRVGYDSAPPAGDRCAMAILLTPEQFAAAKRAEIPTGDKEGEEILKEMHTLQKQFRSRYGDAVLSVAVWSNATREGSAEN